MSLFAPFALIKVPLRSIAGHNLQGSNRVLSPVYEVWLAWFSRGRRVEFLLLLAPYDLNYTKTRALLWSGPGECFGGIGEGVGIEISVALFSVEELVGVIEEDGPVVGAVGVAAFSVVDPDFFW